MSHPYFSVVSSDSGSHHSSCITLDNNPVGSNAGKNGIYSIKHQGSCLGKILPWLHDVEIRIGCDIKQAKHLIQHLAVLASDANVDLRAPPALVQMT